MNTDLYTIQEWNERAGYKPKACINDRILTREEWRFIFEKEIVENLRLSYIKNGCGFGVIPKKEQV